MADKKFYPSWTDTAPKAGSFRSLMKWGAPDVFKHPNKRLYAMMKNVFNLTDKDFEKKQKEGNEIVTVQIPLKLDPSHIRALTDFVGEDNAQTDTFTRIKYSYGKTMIDAMRLREGIIENLPDIVLHPRSREDVQRIVAYCNDNRIAVYVVGAGSSVTRGFEGVKGGVSLAMATHMKRVININETDQTITVEPGIYGPVYEDLLNNAPEKLGTKGRFTGGHFPQSFEFTTVGGWIAALGSGQQSSYYGDAYHIVIGQEIVTPSGTITTRDYPACATGPKINDIIKGSEGAFGIITAVTLKIFKYMPANRYKFSYVFKSWEDAVNAGREIAQGEFGSPSVFRISDQEESDIALKLYGVEGTIIDTLLKLRGFKPMQRCLFLGHTEGEKYFAKNVRKQIHAICKKYGAMSTTGFVVNGWEHGRYKDPYMREDLQDFGIMTDTLECTVKWSQLHAVHQEVRKFIKARPGTICMTHGSHFYPQGTNLYFIFIVKMSDIEEYKKFQFNIIDAIQKSGASLSHHHGVGKMIAPWMEDHLGKEQLNLLRAIKKHLDPHNIMNPGGTLGLDLPESEKRKA